MLPQELIDSVIDSVADGSDQRITLKACSLVAQAWRDRSQAHLHRVLRIAPRTRQLDRMIEAYKSPRLAHNIKKLEITTGKAVWKLWSALSTIMPLFDRVKSLEIHQCASDQPSFVAMQSMLSQWYPEVEELSILACEWPAFEDLANFIGGFSRIRHLSLQDTVWQKYQVLPSTEFPLLQSACILGIWAEDGGYSPYRDPVELLLDWLVGSHTVPLRTLELGVNSYFVHNPQMLSQRVFQPLCKSLQHLTLIFESKYVECRCHHC